MVKDTSDQETDPAPADGRLARSERTRTAIADALLALLDEGDPRPTAERIAARAGVSRRAIFHHFTDVEDVLASAADRQMARVLPMLSPPPADGPVEARIEAYAAQICQLYTRVAPVRRAALLAAPSSPTIAERMRTMRARHHASIERVFGVELSACPEAERDDLSAALVAATSFCTWEELVTQQTLSPAAAGRVIRRSLAALLSTVNSVSSKSAKEKR